MSYSKKQETKTSKMISYLLRHNPEEGNLDMDYDGGWVAVSKLCDHLKIDIDFLKYIVEADNKQRYSFNDDYTKIRANQGHSINVIIDMAELEPPNVLWHGTAYHNLVSIQKNGINRQQRLYVHLSDTMDTAGVVGKRHGKPVVLAIKALQMYADGIKFYLSENGVWLTEYVDPKYIV